MIAAGSAQRVLALALPPWWLVLITGVAWMLVGLVVLRFDYTSVYSISLLFGFVAIAAGILEIGLTFLVSGWWKLLNAILAIAFIVSGIVAFIHPGDTFVALAAVFSFFIIFAGSFDIIQSISARHEIEVWWLQLIGGPRKDGRFLVARRAFATAALSTVPWILPSTLASVIVVENTA